MIFSTDKWIQTRESYKITDYYNSNLKTLYGVPSVVFTHADKEELVTIYS